MTNIVLIGMPGSGKSTVGVILAKLTSMDFIDTDILIQRTDGRSLQEIVDQEGPLALRKVEEEVLLGLDCHDRVIATGGSAVYSESAMKHLKSQGVLVFLDVDLPTLKSRVCDFETRGLAKNKEQTFDELYEERLGLYLRHADVVLDCSGLTHEGVCKAIINALKTRNQDGP